MFSRLDIIINDALVGEAQFPIGASDVKDWWNTMNINLRDSYLTTHAFIPLLPDGGDKRIVYVSSLASFLKMPRLSAYAISKLVLLRFAEFVDAEYECVHLSNIGGTEIKDDVGVPEFLR